MTHAGWTPPNVQLTIAGVNQISNVLAEGFTLTLSVGQSDTLNFTVKNIEPALGSDVKFIYATPGDYWFAGTLLQRRFQLIDATTGVWHCTAVGYEWLINRAELVRRRYNGGVGTIAADLVNSFTNGGFRLGYCPSSLGDRRVDFSFEGVISALERLAQAPDGASAPATIEVTPSKIVNIFLTPPEPSPAATITESMVEMSGFVYGDDLSQVRTSIVGRGKAASATATAPRTSVPTTIAVDDVSPFADPGATPWLGANVLVSTYSGTSVGSGPGTITGVTSLEHDINQGESVSLIVIKTDSAAATALATLLGLSGIAKVLVEDNRLTRTEMNAKAAQELLDYGAAMKEMRFTLKTTRRKLRPGRLVTINMSAPVSVSATMRVQSITVTARNTIGGTSAEFQQSISLSPYRSGDLSQLVVSRMFDPDDRPTTRR